jgi:hypothetical protein
MPNPTLVTAVKLSSVQELDATEDNYSESYDSSDKDDLDAAITHLSNVINTLKQQKRSAITTIAHLEQQLAETTAREKEAAIALGALQQDLELANANQIHLETYIEEREAVINDRTEELAAIRNETQKLLNSSKQQIDEHKKTIAKLIAHIGKLAANNKTEMQRTEARCSQALRREQILQTKNQQLKNDLNRARSELAAYQQNRQQVTTTPVAPAPLFYPQAKRACYNPGFNSFSGAEIDPATLLICTPDPNLDLHPLDYVLAPEDPRDRELAESPESLARVDLLNSSPRPMF